ncbi:hypothetical protein scyTo_0002612 [Scyliorhinus torazame]|uniref:PA domain-containing protein n=1 Tax=Scyliorhinus torazame TaxID=75743 RepID=A0A401PK79_SCYTO|nr:hypothetical protein [Scyliorhinus torazame]
MKGVPGAQSPAWLLLAAAALQTVARVNLAVIPAVVNVTHFSPATNRTASSSVPAIYGNSSPVRGARGVIGIPDSQDALACDQNIDFSARESPWIALIARGNCTFARKISNAKGRGAAAVVIFNEAGKGNRTDPFAHGGAVKVLGVVTATVLFPEDYSRLLC